MENDANIWYLDCPHFTVGDADRFLGTGPIIWRIPIAAGSRPGGTDRHNRARVGRLSRYADPDGVGWPSSFDGDAIVGARVSLPFTDILPSYSTQFLAVNCKLTRCAPLGRR